MTLMQHWKNLLEKTESQMQNFLMIKIWVVNF